MCIAYFANELAARVNKITLPVKIILSKRLDTNAIDRANIVTVRHGVADLLNAPEVLRETARRGRWDEHDLSAIEPQCTSPLRKVAIVANVHANFANRRIKHWIPHIPRAEIELLPKSIDVRDMSLAILT